MKIFRILLTATILFTCNLLFAQDAKPFYKDSTGKLFVQPNTSVFIYISTKADGSDAVKLISTQPEGNPLHWDGHGSHQLTHLNLYLGRRIKFDVFADGHAPKTSATFDATIGVQKNEVVYLSGTCAMELTSIDENSGIKTIFYSVNGSDFKPYTSPLNFDKEGEYILKFYATDNVGNTEDTGERRVIIDTTPPVTKLEIEGPKHNEVISYRSVIKLNATDTVGVKETFYSINNGPEARYVKPIAAGQLAEGEHSISWYSIDIVGNAEQKGAYTFFVDKTPPMVFEEIVGNTYMLSGREFSSGRSQLKIVAVDNKAGVKDIYYSINSNEFVLFEKPIYLSEITGAVTIRSYAIDNVGNKGTSDASGQQFSMPEVDIMGPTISYKFVGSQNKLRDTTWISPQTKVSIIATDKTAGINRIEYKLDDAPTTQFTEAFTVAQSGYHKVSCTAYDNVENLNISSFAFGVDAQEPELFLNFSVKPFKFAIVDGEKIPVFSAGVVLYVAATDDKSGVDKITYTLNDSRERKYSEPITSFKVGQIQEVIIKVTDKLGNQKAEKVRFRVE
jgi:hypothetical protein